MNPSKVAQLMPDCCSEVLRVVSMEPDYGTVETWIVIEQPSCVA